MTLPRLRFYPGTRAVRARWMLEELGIGYDLSVVDLRQAAHKKASYLEIHPLGKVPALEIDGTVLTESLAICLYLADRYWQTDLAPVQEDYADRANYLTWMAFSAGTLEPALLEQVRLRKARDTGQHPETPSAAFAPWEDIVAHVDRSLESREFLCGDTFSAADLMNGSMLLWADRMGLLAGRTNITGWLQRLQRRPAYERATEDLNETKPQ